MNRERLTKRIAMNEGYRREPYRDSLGFWTVGYGHNIHNDALRHHLRHKTVGAFLDALSNPQQHETWLGEDIDTAIHDAERFLGPASLEGLTDARQEVIVEVAYQLGYPSFSTFHKFRAAVLEGDWSKAAHELADSRAAQQTPGRWLEHYDHFVSG